MRYLSFDLKLAKDDPSQVFEHPREVLCMVNLGDQERLDILETWRDLALDRFTQAPSRPSRQRIADIDCAINEILRSSTETLLPFRTAPTNAPAAN